MILSIPETMRWPLLAALLLTGIHVYLGIHVIGRKVIFVDLAMAQIAALGAAIGVLMGYELQHSPWGIFGYSLAFTLLAAFVFSITKMKSEYIPHEAIIGITYAVAVAVALIVLARSPLGPAEFDRMMKGELLYVTKEKVGITAAIYACVGLVHVVFRKQFFALSFRNAEGLKLPRLWDFLFYATFGFVVTSSVSIAGVFLVFCLLVIPSVASFLFSEKTWARLAIGWGGGAALCVVGVKVSYHTGWPTSPVIVVSFAGALVLAGIVKFLLSAPRPSIALAKLTGFACVFALFGSGVWFFRHRGMSPFDEAIHKAHSADEVERLQALEAFEDSPGRKSDWSLLVRKMLDDRNAEIRIRAARLLLGNHDASALPEVVKLLRDRESHVRDQCADLLHKFGDPSVTGDLLSAGDREMLDDPLKIQMYDAALELGDKDAVDRLLDLAGHAEAPKRRRQTSIERLKHHVDFPKPLDGATLAECRAWWKARRDRAVWHPAEHKFVVE